MIKKLVITLCICMFTIAAYAADDSVLSNVEARFSTDGTSVTISGDASGMYNKELIIIITNDGFSDSDISTENKDALLLLNDYTINNDGKFSVTYNLYEQVKDGKYKLYISGEDFKETVIENLWYMHPDARNSLIESIMQSKDAKQLEKALFDDKIEYSDGNLYNAAQRLSLIGSAYSEKYNSYIAEVIFTDKPKNYDDLKYCFNKATAMAAVYFNNYKSIIDSNNNFIVDIWNEKDNAFKALDYYTTVLNVDSKQKLLNELYGKKITQSKDFDTEFIKQTIYYGTYGANIKGYGHIPKMFDTLLSLTGDDFGKYSDLSESEKSTLCSDLHLSQQTDYDNLRLYIYTNAKPKDTGDTSGGSSSKRQSGGSSSGGVGIGDVTVEKGYNADTNSTFIDLNGFDWAKDAIAELKGRGIVNGVSNNAFEPQRGITREEFVKMLVLLLNIETSTDVSFDDVQSDMWYTPFVGAAVKSNLTNGTSNNMFGIGLHITRQDCAVLIYRALKESFAFSDDITLSFDDASDISDYATQAVLCLTNNDIIKGYDNKFVPNGNASRAEVCVMLNRLIERGYIK